MTSLVIDASAGAEIVAGTGRGRALAGLVPVDAEGWVPEHFYAEVLAVVRRQLLVEKLITEAKATVAIGRLRSWHLRRTAPRRRVGVQEQHDRCRCSLRRPGRAARR